MKKMPLIIGIVVLIIAVAGFFGYKAISAPKTPVKIAEEEESESTSYPENTSVEVLVEKSASKDNTLVLEVKKLDKKYADISYEITYETQGVIQGVNSGSKPIELNGQDDFSREVYLGTCSKNVCKPHPGVTSVSVALEFTDSNGEKSQFSKDFSL